MIPRRARFLIIISFMIPLLLGGVEVYANKGGFVGRTLKYNNLGCGGSGCHGSSATPSVNVLISGPSSLSPNETVTYTLTITGGPAVEAGCNIATSRGTLRLIPGDSVLKLIAGELTQKTGKPFSGGSVTFQFSYSAPSTPGTDTLFTVGLSSNKGDSSAGDPWNWAPNKYIAIGGGTSVQQVGREVPTEHELGQNFPNPFNPTTTIEFSLVNSAHVTLTVYDALGGEIRTLVRDNLAPGRYSTQWNASEIPSGVYFYRLTAGLFVQTKKLVVLK